MKKKLLYLFYSLLFFLPTQLLAQTPVTLGTSPYTENFDNISTGLPNGFGIVTGGTSTALGTTATLTATATAWNNTSGAFKNFASANASGLTSSSSSTDQASATNRALGVRPTGSFGDGGAAFVFQIANTTGKTGFKLSFSLQSLDISITRLQTWTIDYGIGANPTSFTTVSNTTGTLSTGSTTWGSNNITVDFGNALDNQSGIITIRIINATTSGSGSRPSSAIDDFSLSWTSGSTATPTLSATPTSLDFGTTQTVGTTSAAKTFSLSASDLTSDVTLTTTAPYSVSADGTTYGLTATFTAAQLATTQTAYVKFAPTGTTATTGSVSISSSGATTQTVSLTGTGAAVPTPTLSATPTSLDFGTTQTVGTTSAAKTFSLSASDLTSDVTLTTTAPYSVSADGTTYGLTATFTAAQLATTQTAYVKFAPTSTTAATGSVSISSSGATTQTVSLTGTGAAVPTPTLSATPTSLDFGTTQTVGTTSAAKTFSLSATNLTSDVTLTTTAPYSVSADGTTYGLTATFTAAQLATTQTAYVKFAPTGTTAATGSVSITSSGATTQTVSLTGTGAAATSTGASHVVISEVYGGGGNSNAVFTNDYVELYNPTNADVVMTNWSIQYTSAAGTSWGSTSSTIAPFSGTIKSHGFFLIGLAAGTSVTNKPLPTTDATGPINMSASAGKVALVNNTTQLSQVANPTDASIVDLLGYYTSGGATVTNGFETAYLTAPSSITSNTWSAERKANATSTQATLAAGGADELAGNGYDTNDNSSDFVVQTTPNPQNSASPTEPAAATPSLSATPTSLDFGTTQTVGTTSAAKTFSLSATNLTSDVTLTTTAPYSVSADGTTYGLTATFTAAQLATTQTAYVKFAPTGTTAATGSVSISSSGATTQTVSLTGTGAAATSTGASHVVISEMYGGGGNSGSVYTNDFIELYNPTSADVDISGWSVAYSSATGTTYNSANQTIVPASTTIKSHGYFLIQEAAGSGTSAALPTPDLIGTIAIGASAGKVVLLSDANLPSSVAATGSNVVDFLGFGTTASVYEGSGPAPAPSNSTSVERKAFATSTAATMAAGGSDDLKGNGYDSDDNASDFVVPAVVNPQNSASPTEPAATNPTGPTLTLAPTSLTFSQPVGSASAAQSFTITGSNLTADASVSVVAPYSISATASGTYGTSLTFTQAQLASPQTVYVEFTPTAAGAASGAVTVTSSGATSQSVALTGTGISTANTAPTINTINDVAVCYTPVQQTIALSGITAGNETGQTLVMSVTSNNSSLFSQLGGFQASGGATTGQINYTIAPNASGTAVVTVTLKDNGGTANGGVDTYTTSFNLTVNSVPNVNIVSNVGTNITKGVIAQLTATNGGTSYAWTWTGAASDIINGQNTAVLNIRPKASGTCTVVVTNATGCSTTKTIAITVTSKYPLVTSNILTPNGDGKNDTWIIKNIDYYPASTVKVIDKAGKIVFSATNYRNDWDGTFNGQPLTQGTYYYVIDLGGGAPKYTGYITLIRD